jgi:para-nitrobenzyl esterase
MSVTRRSFLQTAAATGTAALAGGVAPSAALAATVDSKATDKPTVIARDTENIVETAYGKVRGSERNGIHVFLGIPYGADTSGANRFMPAKAPTPWPGVRSTLQYGPTAPTSWTPPAGDESRFVYENDLGLMSESCLVANVWTQGINDNKKRPVLVWMHGGGFFHGSCQELKAYDGEMLSRSGDVVVVSFNHRLNTFGFLNLSEFGPEYADSGNVGIMDLVFLLEWVRNNVSNFGGDPGNVTIMGQSGGGAKVGTLMAMPSAKGLFHKASIHSGTHLRVIEKEESLRTAHATLAQLDVNKNNLDKLYAISWHRLIGAWQEIQRRGNAITWSAYVDGNIIPRQPWDPSAPEISADVPLMVGTVLNETFGGADKPDCFSMTEEEMMTDLSTYFGARTREIVEVFREGHPKANPFQLSTIIKAGGSQRAPAMIQAQRKAALGKAPAYNWWLHWQTPILSGRAMAFHCSDLSFFFNNAERCAQATGNGPEAQTLAAQMSQAWIQFARTGNPNHPGIPNWEPVNVGGSQTMIFDTNTHFSEDPDSAEWKLVCCVSPSSFEKPNASITQDALNAIKETIS